MGGTSSFVQFNIFVVLLTGLSLILGIMLWRNVPRARRFSLIWQLLQVPHVATSLLVYDIVVGVNASIMMKGPLLWAEWRLGTSFTISVGRAVPEPTFGLNLVALLLAGLLWSASRPHAASVLVEQHPRADAA